MRQQLQEDEHRLQQRDSTSRQGADEMQQRLKYQQMYIQERQAALVHAQQQLGATIQGKKQCEAHVHEEMQNAARNHRQLEMDAEHMKHEHEHQQRLSARG